MNGIESPILSYSDPIQFSQVPLTQFCTFWTENLHSFAPSGRDFFFSPNSAPLRREFRDLLRKLSRLAYGLFKHRIAF